LVSHYLPLVFKLAFNHPGGDFLRKIEAGNRARSDCFRNGNCRPWDDVDYIVRDRVKGSFDTQG